MHESVALIFFCCYPHPYIVVCDVIRIPVMREVYIYNKSYLKTQITFKVSPKNNFLILYMYK